MLFNNKIGKDPSPTNEKAMLEDAFHLLRTNINMQSVEKQMHTFMVTSTLPNEGKSSIVLKLATQFASTNQKVLIINADTRRPALDKYVGATQKRGLTDLFYKLFAEPVRDGNISDYGLTDLLYLYYLQARTGRLTLKSADQQLFTVHIDHGIICSIDSKDNDLNLRLLSTLTSLKKLNLEDGQAFLDRSTKMQIPLVKLILDFNLCSPQDLKSIYEFELISLLKDLHQKKLVSFDFKEIFNESYKAITKLLEDTQDIFLDQLQNHKFIAQQINDCVFSAQHNFYYMPAGELKMKLSEIFTAQRLSKLVKLLKHQFDIIFFDTPPISIGAEATVVGSVTDGTLLVIKSDYANRQKIQKTVNQLKLAKVNILGAILNEAPMKGKYDYYNYYTES